MQIDESSRGRFEIISPLSIFSQEIRQSSWFIKSQKRPRRPKSRDKVTVELSGEEYNPRLVDRYPG